MAFIFYGLGGIGTSCVLRLKKKMKAKENLRENRRRDVFFYGIDIQPNYDVDRLGEDFDAGCRYTIPGLKNPQSVVNQMWKGDSNFKKWWLVLPNGNPWTHKDPILPGQEAERIRANGRLLFYYYFKGIYDFLINSLINAQVLEAIGQPATSGASHLIFIVSSLGGGTGSGILIDTIFAIRDIVGDIAKIFGVFIDGTVTETGGARGSGVQSIGALVEIERWMVKPEEFKMNYHKGSLPQRLDKFTRFLDGVLLVQYYNSQSRCFVGNKTGNLIDDYKELVAEFLYPFAVGKTQITSDLNNLLSRLPHNLLYKNKRSLQYGSLAISTIVFPYEWIAKRITSGIIVDIFKKEGRFGEFKANLDEIDIYVKTQSLMPDQLRDSLNPLKTQLDDNIFSKQKRLIENSKKRNVIENIKNANWNNFDQWEINNLTNYKQGIQETLNKYLEEQKNKLKETIEREIHKLDFKGIKDWLRKLEEFCNRQIQNLTRATLPIPTQQELNVKIKMLEDQTKKILISRWKACRSDFVGMFKKWKDNKVIQIENNEIVNFYNHFKNHIESVTEVVEFIEETSQKIYNKHFEEVGKQTARETLVDKDRFAVGDYPLTLEVRTKKIEERCREKIEEILRNKEILEALRNGISEDKERYIGICKIFEDSYNGLYGKNENAKGAFKEANQKKFEENIEGLFKISIEKRVKDILFNYSVYDALNWYITDLYKKIKEEMQPRDRHQYLTTLRYDFTDESAKLLIEDENLQDFDSWKENAYKGLLERFKFLTKPFYQLDEGKITSARSSIDPSVLNSLSFDSLLRVYAPENPPKEIKDSFPTGITFALGDPHQIAITGMEFCTPLFALKELITLNNEYKRHIMDFPKKGGIPVHTDMRFYTDWKDDIMLEDPLVTEEETEAILLYALGIGTGIIERDAKGKFKYGGKTLATSLPKLIEKFKKFKKEQDALKNDIKTQIEKRTAGKPNVAKLKEIQNIFVEAYKFHQKIKPGGGQAAPGYETWENIAKKMRAEIAPQSGDIILNTLGDLVPRDINDEKFIKIKESLEE